MPWKVPQSDLGTLPPALVVLPGKISFEGLGGRSLVGLCCVVINGSRVLSSSTVRCPDSVHSGTYRLTRSTFVTASFARS